MLIQKWTAKQIVLQYLKGNWTNILGKTFAELEGNRE